LKRAVEEAEKAAQSLKHDLRKAKALIDETRARLQNPVAPEQPSFNPARLADNDP
jgi:hypothetical protein